MKQFVAQNPDVEIFGMAVLTIAEAMGPMKEMGYKILAESNIENPDPHAWYKVQDWLNAFKLISEKIGSNTLFLMGQSIPDNIPHDPGQNTLDKALAGINISYHMNHRLNGERLFNIETGRLIDCIGNYKYKRISENNAEMIVDTPYPCDLEKGIIKKVASKFMPEVIHYLEIKEKPEECRNNGADSCVYNISW
ncbi:hypothetical protein GF354_01095 [Candidatus Peregrinibacteria bacterium]|nr:hypothetical protein [Candidatus Peregrinibacteria bacterium]